MKKELDQVTVEAVQKKEANKKTLGIKSMIYIVLVLLCCFMPLVVVCAFVYFVWSRFLTHLEFRKKQRFKSKYLKYLMKYGDINN